MTIISFGYVGWILYILIYVGKNYTLWGRRVFENANYKPKNFFIVIKKTKIPVCFSYF